METEKEQSGESQGLGEGEATEPGVWRASPGDGASTGSQVPRARKLNGRE